MKIAFVTSREPGEVDRLLRELADSLMAQKQNLTGIVKVIVDSSAYDPANDMDVEVLPTGQKIQVTQSLGPGSSGCRLDPAGIAQAVACVEATALENSELFILNKFGPEEANGRGFCSVIGQALDHNVPVLVGVGAANIEAFESFAAGMAQQLSCDITSLTDWLSNEPRP